MSCDLCVPCAAEASSDYRFIEWKRPLHRAFLDIYHNLGQFRKEIQNKIEAKNINLIVHQG